MQTDGLVWPESTFCLGRLPVIQIIENVVKFIIQRVAGMMFPIQTSGKDIAGTQSAIVPVRVQHSVEIIFLAGQQIDDGRSSVKKLPDEYPYGSPAFAYGCGKIVVQHQKIVAVVPCHYKYNVPPFSPVDDVTKKLGQNVAAFLADEVKHGRVHKDFQPIQSGVGNIANAVLAALQDAPEIPPFTLYTEVLQDQGVELIDKGRCTFASTGSLAVSDAVYDRIMDNIDFYKEHIILRPYELSNHPELVRRLGVITINTALEVDICGNVNSTHVMGTTMMNGVGGSADFARNAYTSIFICPSIAKKGAISAIVPYVSHVDSSEHSVMVVITEQGVADLRGKSPRERAEAIIENCAHPDYRPLLREYLNLPECQTGHTPMSLENAFAFHREFKKSGDMHNVKFE